MKAALRFAWREARFLKVPVCMFQGALDFVVDPQAAEVWLESLLSHDKQFHLLPEHFHELHNEPGLACDNRDGRRLAARPHRGAPKHRIVTCCLSTRSGTPNPGRFTEQSVLLEAQPLRRVF